MMKHDILISYSDEDKQVAEQLKSVFVERFGETVWLRDFDLNAGDKIADVISDIIAEIKWFILIYSEHSRESAWLKLEADIALWSALEKQGFEIIIIKLDRSSFLPTLVAIAGARQKPVFDLSRVSDYVPEWMRLADYIEQLEPKIKKGDIFVDRGADKDKFSLLIRQNKIIFIIGLAGIGKTAFVMHSVAEALGKAGLEIKLTRGHSLDRLSREILQKAHAPQPMENISPNILLKGALDALKSREKRVFLLLNYAEYALNTSNEMLSFLRDFLNAFVESGIDTHVILATTRNPEIPLPIARVTNIYSLKGLETPYIQECIQRWIEDAPQNTQKINPSTLGEIAALASGHPLAARFIAMQLKEKGPSVLLTAMERRRVELKLGSFLLESIDKGTLGEVHHLMLQVLAVIREPMTVEDMMVIKAINSKYRIDELQRARSKLIELLLIEQNYELMSLNSFLMAYYQNQVDQLENRQDQFANDYGEYAYKNAIALKKKWDSRKKLSTGTDGELNKISNDIFRYALAADRLLRIAGKDTLVDQLPIRISGAVRDLVIHYYQHKKDYRRALKYSEEWLKQHPNDTEIILFQIRCYRNIEDPLSLSKAEEIIANLESTSNNPRLRQRLLRERAMVSERHGNLEQAEMYYRQGINMDTYNPYPENHIGLAHLLLRKLDRQNFSYFDERKIAQEAVNLLEIGRNQSFTFDQFHLSTYIEALIQAEQADRAYPLLEETLRYAPEDQRLNLKMAEILRERGDYERSASYAQKALLLGARKASLTLANIEYAKGKSLIQMGQSQKAKERFTSALTILKGFTPEYGRDEEVCDGIRSKIYRELDDWDSAQKTISKYLNSINPYTIYEQIRISIHEAHTQAESGQKDRAIEILDSIIQRVNDDNHHDRLPSELLRALSEAIELRDYLK